MGAKRTYRVAIQYREKGSHRTLKQVEEYESTERTCEADGQKVYRAFFDANPGLIEAGRVVSEPF